MKKTIITSIGAFILFVTGIIIGNQVIPPLCSPSKNPWQHVKVLAVPDVRQSTTYSCGAASFQAVLSYWGIDKREGNLMEMLHSSKTSGTNPETIVRVAEKLGLRAKIEENLTIEDLKKSIAKGVPVIVAIQAWVDSLTKDFNWVSDWEDGHYVVVLGLDKQNVYVEDPSLLGTKGVIPVHEFINRWHDYSGEPPLDSRDRKWIHLGIFIEGDKPVSQEAFTKVE